jgi:hypothetical protein
VTTCSIAWKEWEDPRLVILVLNNRDEQLKPHKS